MSHLQSFKVPEKSFRPTLRFQRPPQAPADPPETPPENQTPLPAPAELPGPPPEPPPGPAARPTGRSEVGLVLLDLHHEVVQVDEL